LEGAGEVTTTEGLTILCQQAVPEGGLLCGEADTPWTINEVQWTTGWVELRNASGDTVDLPALSLQVARGAMAPRRLADLPAQANLPAEALVSVDLRTMDLELFEDPLVLELVLDFSAFGLSIDPVVLSSVEINTNLVELSDTVSFCLLPGSTIFDRCFATRDEPNEALQEENTSELCDDGLDNDGDMLTDCADSTCIEFCGMPEDTEERCRDGEDNDLDNDIDCGDADCQALPLCMLMTEDGTPESCRDGADNDRDGDLDCDDSDCSTSPSCAPEISPRTCSDTLDNDGDGNADCDDPKCQVFQLCASRAESDEVICIDTQDNDGDGAVDCGDQSCVFVNNAHNVCPGDDLVINEISAGQFGVELRNNSPVPILLLDWRVRIRDDMGVETVLGPIGGIMIPADQHAFLSFDSALGSPPGFSLPSAGSLELENPGGALIDRVEWAAGEADLSRCRLPDGSEFVTVCGTATPFAANQP